ncbi:MAG: hypothetical protein ACLTDM_11150 [Clostridium butyricum]
MKKVDSIWFNEDGDLVFGIKRFFKNEKEFIEEAEKTHVELTGYGCIIGDVETDTFLSVDESLKGQYVYKLADSGATVDVLYWADCESLEE